jgi:hypothetical protein
LFGGLEGTAVTKPNIKITAKQNRFVFDSGKVWMIQPLHVAGGVPDQLRGDYSVPLDEQRKNGWGNLNGKQEVTILREWVQNGFKL